MRWTMYHWRLNFRRLKTNERIRWNVINFRNNIRRNVGTHISDRISNTLWIDIIRDKKRSSLHILSNADCKEESQIISARRRQQIECQIFVCHTCSPVEQELRKFISSQLYRCQWCVRCRFPLTFSPVTFTCDTIASRNTVIALASRKNCKTIHQVVISGSNDFPVSFVSGTLPKTMRIFRRIPRTMITKCSWRKFRTPSSWFNTLFSPKFLLLHVNGKVNHQSRMRMTYLTIDRDCIWVRFSIFYCVTHFRRDTHYSNTSLII